MEIRRTPTELIVSDSSAWVHGPSWAVFESALIITVVVSVGLFIPIYKPWDLLFFVLLGGLIGAIERHRTRFVFDSLDRTVSWRRRRYFKTSLGTLAFDEINDISIETIVTKKGKALHRLSVVTASAAIPMSEGFSDSGFIVGSKSRIVRFVKGTEAPGLTDDGLSAELEKSLRSLLAQGRKIDAIKLLREHVDLRLYDAKKLVDTVQAEMD